LREKPKDEVLSAVKSWVKSLDTKDTRYEHHLLEAAWVTWGHNAVDRSILDKLLNSKDHRVRAAAIKMVRYNGDILKDQDKILSRAAQDPHGRVRLEALVAASWLDAAKGKPIADAVGRMPMDVWIKSHQEAVVTNFTTRLKPPGPSVDLITDGVTGKGKEIYLKEGYCSTCHQQDGKGLDASGFPSLYKSEWVVGDAERLVKLTMHGLMGPITVGGKKYDGKVPMTAFGKLLNDEELAAVLTYIRKSFGNNADDIKPEFVKTVREKTKTHKGYYLASEL
jgi:mono/diheme cytochrome c family protein